MLTFVADVGLRGQGPSLCMCTQATEVEELVRGWLGSYCARAEAAGDLDFFVVGVKIQRDKVAVLIDRETCIDLEECVEVSRGLSELLEAHGVDRELEVSSPGLTSPFEHPRQYAKYRGHWVEVLGADRRWHEGVLRGYHAGTLELEESVMVLAPGAKRKHKEQQVNCWPEGSYSACRLSWDKIGRGNE